MYILVYLPSKLCPQPTTPAANYGKREFYLFLFFFLTTFACSQPQCLLHTSIVKIIPSEALSFPQNARSLQQYCAEKDTHYIGPKGESREESGRPLLSIESKTINNSTYSFHVLTNLKIFCPYYKIYQMVQWVCKCFKYKQKFEL